MSENHDEIAREQIKSHIDVCAERYGGIWTALGEIKADQRTISRQMFSIVCGACGAAFATLISVIIYLLTHQVHP